MIELKGEGFSGLVAGCRSGLRRRVRPAHGHSLLIQAIIVSVLALATVLILSR